MISPPLFIVVSAISLGVNSAFSFVISLHSSDESCELFQLVPHAGMLVVAHLLEGLAYCLLCPFGDVSNGVFDERVPFWFLGSIAIELVRHFSLVFLASSRFIGLSLNLILHLWTSSVFTFCAFVITIIPAGIALCFLIDGPVLSVNNSTGDVDWGNEILHSFFIDTGTILYTASLSFSFAGLILCMAWPWLKKAANYVFCRQDMLESLIIPSRPRPAGARRRGSRSEWTGDVSEYHYNDFALHFEPEYSDPMVGTLQRRERFYCLIITLNLVLHSARYCVAGEMRLHTDPVSWLLSQLGSLVFPFSVTLLWNKDSIAFAFLYSDRCIFKLLRSLLRKVRRQLRAVKGAMSSPAPVPPPAVVFSATNQSLNIYF